MMRRKCFSVATKAVAAHRKAIAALLGAEEFGFGTTVLVSRGCIMHAQVPPEHLPRGRGHAGPGPAEALQGQAGICGTSGGRDAAGAGQPTTSRTAATTSSFWAGVSSG